MSRKLTIDDIADLRAYERERADYRARIIALKKHRRVSVGPFVTFVFENRYTMRFQVQEMARAEKIISDEGIQAELDVYNPLIPELGTLSATMFIELTTDEELRTWLPRLVGIERAPVLRLPAGDAASSVRRDIAATVDADHGAQLTRDDITASVHYVRFSLSAAEIAALAAGPVRLVLEHPNYRYEVTLDADTVTELLADLRG